MNILSAMKRLRQGEVSAAEAYRLLEQFDGIFDRELSTMVQHDHHIQLYQLNDNKVLWAFLEPPPVMDMDFPYLSPRRIEHGMLFESREVAQQVLRALQLDRQEHHALSSFFTGGPQFPGQVPALIDELAAKLEIPREALDGSIKSLDVIAQTILIYGHAAFGEPDTFTGLLAYVSEVVRQAVNGQWFMEYVPEWGVWEPNLKDEKGRVYSPWGYLIAALEEEDPGPAQGFLELIALRHFWDQLEAYECS